MSIVKFIFQLNKNTEKVRLINISKNRRLFDHFQYFKDARRGAIILPTEFSYCADYLQYIFEQNSTQKLTMTLVMSVVKLYDQLNCSSLMEGQFEFQLTCNQFVKYFEKVFRERLIDIVQILDSSLSDTILIGLVFKSRIILKTEKKINIYYISDQKKLLLKTQIDFCVNTKLIFGFRKKFYKSKIHNLFYFIDGQLKPTFKTEVCTDEIARDLNIAIGLLLQCL